MPEDPGPRPPRRPEQARRAARPAPAPPESSLSPAGPPEPCGLPLHPNSGPDPRAPAPRPAIQPARTPGPHQVDVGEPGEHKVLEELTADAARAHHQHPAPGHGLGQLPGKPPRQSHGETTTSRDGGGGGRTELRPEAGGGRAAQLPFLRSTAASRRQARAVWDLVSGRPSQGGL